MANIDSIYRLDDISLHHYTRHKYSNQCLMSSFAETSVLDPQRLFIREIRSWLWS